MLADIQQFVSIQPGSQNVVSDLSAFNNSIANHSANELVRCQPNERTTHDNKADMFADVGLLVNVGIKASS